MLKQKGKVFIDKCHLLSSQEHSEDIHWSSSETTDTENASFAERTLIKKVQSRKRKRKKKLSRNISNLDITVMDIPKEAIGDKSPIISHNIHKGYLVTSPVLRSSTQLITRKPTRRESTQSTRTDLTSPILFQKHSSPSISTKSRKKLFKTGGLVETCSDGRISPIFATSSGCKEKTSVVRETTKENVNIVQIVGSERLCNSNFSKAKKPLKSQSINCSNEKTGLSKDMSSTSRNKNCFDPEIKQESISYKDCEVASAENTSIIGNTSDESFMIKSNHSAELAKKVKAYFDSHFSSESPSQHSITETQTPKEETKSDDIEIVSSLTQVTRSNKSSFVSVSKIESPAESFATDSSTEKTRKLKYKKDGLAHRLNVLLRKQNANLSLWQHERYLAMSSNFEIPKGEHSIFRIRKVDHKYGCYLIDAIDVNNKEFTIAIGGQYSNCDLSEDTILKLYQPFTILDSCGDRKIIINPYKFESISL